MGDNEWERAMERQQTITAPAELSERLERWVASGVISAVQADQIRQIELLDNPPAVAERAGERRSSLISEALGYLGGVLLIAALIVITTWYWDDMAVGARLGLAGGTSLLALAGGVAAPVRLRAAGGRLRAVLWLVSVVTFAGFAGIFGADILDLSRGEDIVLLAAITTLPYAVVLCLRYSTAVQHAVFFGTVIAATASAAAHLDFANGAEPGLGIWLASSIWFALALANVIPPQRAGYVLGAAGAVIGALATTGENWGHVLALVTVAALVAAAVLVGDHIVLAIGAVGAAIALPQTLTSFLPSAVAVPLGLVAVGLLLVIVAVRIARGRGT